MADSAIRATTFTLSDAHLTIARIEPTPLEFVAENPVRHDNLPPNIVEIARMILDAGTRADERAVNSTLGLVCSGRVPREHSVQIPLIEWAGQRLLDDGSAS